MDAVCLGYSLSQWLMATVLVLGALLLGRIPGLVGGMALVARDPVASIFPWVPLATRPTPSRLQPA